MEKLTAQTERLIREWLIYEDKRDEIRKTFLSDQYKYYKWWHHRDLITEEFVSGIDISSIWSYLFYYGDAITNSFIRAYATKISWMTVCYHVQLTDDQIREFSEYIDWFTLAYYGRRGLSPAIIEEFGHLFDDNTWNLIRTHFEKNSHRT